MKQYISMNKIKMYLAGAAIAVSGVIASVAHGASLFGVPTSTVSTLTASITDTLTDPGLLAIIAFVIALPVVFWLIGRVKALFPKSK